MEKEIGLPAIIDGFMQGIRPEIASAASQTPCWEMKWHLLVKLLVEIERRLPQVVPQTYNQGMPRIALATQYHEDREEQASTKTTEVSNT